MNQNYIDIFYLGVLHKTWGLLWCENVAEYAPSSSLFHAPYILFSLVSLEIKGCHKLSPNNIHQFLTLLFPITDTARQHSSIVIMVCVVLFHF